LSLTHAVLGVLDARPMNGYELSQFFDSSAGWVWSAPRSQIYPTLRKMEQEGLIEAERQVRGTKLERRVYSITEAGLAELRRWVAEPSDTTMKRDPVLLQALFLDMVEPELAAKVFEHVIDEQEAFIARWEMHAQRLLDKETPLIRERLKRRPSAEHDRIAAIKAHVFAGGVALAKTRAEWAAAGLQLLRQQGSPLPGRDQSDGSAEDS
jgi:DNA-binding PadR family transcriptional regulator